MLGKDFFWCSVAKAFARGGIQIATEPAEVQAVDLHQVGDGNWMSMKDAAKLFPDDGEIVVGERYRVNRDTIKDIPFNPSDKMTWGQGETNHC